MTLGKLKLFAAATAILAAIVAPTQARGLRDLLAAPSAQPTAIPAVGRIEVGFSPDEGAEELVVRVIRSAAHPGGQLRMLAYSLTSPTIVHELIAAKHAGADEKIVADFKENVTEDRSGKGRAALGALANAGADVRTISVYPIHHDKVIVVDQQTVEEGSFNYSVAAARRNSEQAMALWNNPALAAVYLRHFERNYAQSTPYRPGY